MEMMGVRIPAPTPFCTNTSMGTEAPSSSGLKAMASMPMMESIMAMKLHRNMYRAARSTCLTSVRGSVCWYISPMEGSWNAKYRMALFNAAPNSPLSLELTGSSPAAIRPMDSVMVPNWTMMLGTSTTTRPMMMSTDSVEAHFRTMLVPYREMMKMNAPTTRVHSQ